MFLKNLGKYLQNIDCIINIINGSKDRYRISVTPNNIKFTVEVIVTNLNTNESVYDNTIQTSRSNYISFINAIRDTFIGYNALISKLSHTTTKQKLCYYQQEIYFNNLEMKLKINNKKEELEAVKAHQRILTNNFPIIYKTKIKTIQTQNNVG